MWDEARKRAKVNDIETPDYKAFVAQEFHKLAPVGKPRVMFSEFRSDPEKYPLAMPSGKIELFSKVVAAFGYEDARGMPSEHAAGMDGKRHRGASASSGWQAATGKAAFPDGPWPLCPILQDQGA